MRAPQQATWRLAARPVRIESWEGTANPRWAIPPSAAPIIETTKMLMALGTRTPPVSRRPGMAAPDQKAGKGGQNPIFPWIEWRHELRPIPKPARDDLEPRHAQIESICHGHRIDFRRFRRARCVNPAPRRQRGQMRDGHCPFWCGMHVWRRRLRIASSQTESAACGWLPRQAYPRSRSCGRVAEGGGLLNRYRLVKAYRGFESLRLRQ